MVRCSVSLEELEGSLTQKQVGRGPGGHGLQAGLWSHTVLGSDLGLSSLIG